MEIQLDMWPGVRERLIERHDFYLEQVKVRVLSQFADIEGEADNYAEAEYKHLASLSWGEGVDLSDVAELAHEQAINHYSLLHDLKREVTLGALAGLYHRWDKDLRDFIERGSGRYIGWKDASKDAWEPNVGNVLDNLVKSGWNCRSTAWFPRVDACRLIVNVYKHGNGRSLEDLRMSYPNYLCNPTAPLEIPLELKESLSHEFLEISDQQFDKIATALRRFWEEFPERLFLTSLPPRPS